MFIFPQSKTAQFQILSKELPNIRQGRASAEGDPKVHSLPDHFEIKGTWKLVGEDRANGH